MTNKHLADPIQTPNSALKAYSQPKLKQHHWIQVTGISPKLGDLLNEPTNFLEEQQ